MTSTTLFFNVNVFDCIFYQPNQKGDPLEMLRKQLSDVDMELMRGKVSFVPIFFRKLYLYSGRFVCTTGFTYLFSSLKSKQFYSIPSGLLIHPT